MADEQARATVERAWELGIRTFDTAPLYGSGLAEERVGAALQRQAARRVRVSTKVGRLLRAGRLGGSDLPGRSAARRVFDFSYDGALRSLEESLERLGLDRVDIALVHDPDDHYDEALAGALPRSRGCATRGRRARSASA